MTDNLVTTTNKRIHFALFHRRTYSIHFSLLNFYECHTEKIYAIVSIVCSVFILVL